MLDERDIFMWLSDNTDLGDWAIATLSQDLADNFYIYEK